MAWYAANWHELDTYVVPPFIHGSARSVGTYKGVANTCPDGRVNAWEATVPNGLYLVTSSGARGCSFENVLGSGNWRQPGGSNIDTRTTSVEVSDGKFTLSSTIPSRCAITKKSGNDLDCLGWVFS